MRIVECAATVLLVSFASAQSVSPRLASIIPQDAALVYSIDLEKYADSALQSFYPMAEANAEQCLGKSRQIIIVERAQTAGGGKLMILRGVNAAPGGARTDQMAESGPALKLTMLDMSTALAGDPDTVQSALERWQQQATATDGDLAAKVRQMSETYDNWLIAIRPLHASVAGQSGGSHLSYRSQFTDMVEEVRAGIRLGKINEFEIDMEMKTPEDATASAGLGRWLRGLVQTRGGPEADFAEVAEDLRVTATGKVVSLSFTLDSAKVRELAKEQRAREKVGQDEVDLRPDASATSKQPDLRLDLVF